MAFIWLGLVWGLFSFRQTWASCVCSRYFTCYTVLATGSDLVMFPTQLVVWDSITKLCSLLHWQQSRLLFATCTSFAIALLFHLFVRVLHLGVARLVPSCALFVLVTLPPQLAVLVIWLNSMYNCALSELCLVPLAHIMVSWRSIDFCIASYTLYSYCAV